MAYTMKIAVITPYYKESNAELERCHQSVMAQQGDVTHFMLADGYPNPIVDTWNCQHIILPNHNDFGDTPRGIGAASASAQGFEGICFLDADNWYEPTHIANIRDCFHKYQIPLITTARQLHTIEGVFLGTCTESNGKDFVDTNCYFFHQSVFKLCRSWLFKTRREAMGGDRILWNSIVTQDIKRAHIHIPTLNYVTDFSLHYAVHGLTPPPHSRIFSHKQGQYISYAEYQAELATSNQ